MNTELQKLYDDSWQQLLAGSRQPDHAFHNTTVANLAAHGINVYTVVLRDIVPETGQVVFYTDARSEKIAEIQADYILTALFYDREKQIQIIVKGAAAIEQHSDNTLNYWKKDGFKGRKSYLAELPPSTPVGQAEDGLAYLQDKKFSEEDMDGYSNFAVVTIKATEFEYLQLSKETGNRRARFRLDREKAEGTWIIP